MLEFISETLAFLEEIQLAIAAGFFSLAGVLISRSVARSQVSVAKQALFASLYPERRDWLRSFKRAINEWDSQMQAIIRSSAGSSENSALFEIEDLINSSRTLFGPEVTKAAREVEQALEVVRDLRIKAADGDREAARLASSQLTRVYRLLGEVRNVSTPYLYVGDIRNETKAAKPRARIEGMFRG